jgi:hypothetical protein
VKKNIKRSGKYATDLTWQQQEPVEKEQTTVKQLIDTLKRCMLYGASRGTLLCIQSNLESIVTNVRYRTTYAQPDDPIRIRVVGALEDGIAMLQRAVIIQSDQPELLPSHLNSCCQHLADALSQWIHTDVYSLI